MTLDHVDKYLLYERATPLFALGRLALPLFTLVLAYNLARPDALAHGVYPRLMGRLALAAAVAEIPFMALGGLGWGWWPLNILVTLLLATTILWLIELGGLWRRALAIALFIAGGSVVEFWWPGVAMCLAAWGYCRRPNSWALGLWIAATASLYVINRNFWALAAFPIIFYAPHATWHMPRFRHVFYAYYPAHLAVLWALSAWLLPMGGQR